jgi:hypothetical protein
LDLALALPELAFVLRAVCLVACILFCFVVCCSCSCSFLNAKKKKTNKKTTSTYKTTAKVHGRVCICICKAKAIAMVMVRFLYMHRFLACLCLFACHRHRLCDKTQLAWYSVAVWLGLFLLSYDTVDPAQRNFHLWTRGYVQQDGKQLAAGQLHMLWYR